MGKVRNHHFYVCSHTHWDREWYGTFEDFRMRLVELTDELLDYLEDESEYRCFNFDGQASVIRDYLEIRPERREDIARFVAAGRLVVGPWYILPDQFLVSGESFVQNLRLGHRIAGEFGRVLKVGYLPDCFGQISQIPQILLGFSIDNFLFWRGFAPDDDRPEVFVEGPDGSRVLGYHFQEHGYSNLALFPHQAPPDVQEMVCAEDGSVHWTARARFLAMRHIAGQLAERDRSKVHLLMNGFDHMRIHKDLPEVLRRANEECEGWTFHHATLEEFIDALKEERGAWPLARTPMRDTTRDSLSPGFILDGVLSSRVYLKQANARCQTLLERWVAPFETLKWLDGARYERAFLERAWELLLQNHPHDSICGCSIDAVHRDMENRFARCEEIARQLLGRSLGTIAARIDGSFAEPHEGVLVVFNALPYTTSQLVETNLKMNTAGGIRVADPANEQEARPLLYARLASASEVARHVRGVRLFDHEGKEIALGVDSIDVEATNEPGPHTDERSSVGNRLVAGVRFWADDLPPLGYRAYRFHFLRWPTARRGDLVTGPARMENAFLQVAIQPDGSFQVADKRTDPPSRHTVSFEDGADCGDSYNFAKPPGDRVVSTLGGPARVALVEDSPAAAAFEIRHRLELPADFDFERRVRSDRTVSMEIVTRVTLGVRSRYVSFRTRLRNTARYHRLRILFCLDGGIDKDSLAAAADGPFDVVEWPIQPPHPNPEGWAEDQPSTIPMQSFVDVSDGARGAAVFTKGLPECEVVRDPAPRMYLTLFRSFGHISRPDLPSRGRACGESIATPEGQCLREMEFEYALYPHAGNWCEGNVLPLTREFVSGVAALSICPGAGELPPVGEFLQLEGDPGVALSTIERSQDGEAVIVRVWNGTAEKREARLIFDRPVRSAQRVRLDETVEETLKVTRRREIPLKLGPKKILTVRAVLERGAD